MSNTPARDSAAGELIAPIDCTAKGFFAEFRGWLKMPLGRASTLVKPVVGSVAPAKASHMYVNWNIKQ